MREGRRKEGRNKGLIQDEQDRGEVTIRKKRTEGRYKEYEAKKNRYKKSYTE